MHMHAQYVKGPWHSQVRVIMRRDGYIYTAIGMHLLLTAWVA